MIQAASCISLKGNEEIRLRVRVSILKRDGSQGHFGMDVPIITLQISSVSLRSTVLPYIVQICNVSLVGVQAC